MFEAVEPGNRSRRGDMGPTGSGQPFSVRGLRAGVMCSNFKSRCAGVGM